MLGESMSVRSLFYSAALDFLLHRYRERSWVELVDLWVALNRHLAAVIQSVSAEKLQTSCTIGDRAPTSLEWWMRDYLRHLKHHLAQMAGQ